MRGPKNDLDPAYKAGYEFGYRIAGPILVIAALAVVVWAVLGVTGAVR